MTDQFGTALGADALVMVFAVPVIAVVIAWWGTRIGIHRSDWDHDVSLRSIGTGLVVVAYFVVYVGLVLLLTSVLGTELPANSGRVDRAGPAPRRGP